MKPTKIFVKPARPGMNLRHPLSGPLPDSGRRWVDDSFTQRRIADGGIVIASPPSSDDNADQEPAAAVPAVQPAKPVAAAAAPAKA